jgi:hypothetical protein
MTDNRAMLKRSRPGGKEPCVGGEALLLPFLFVMKGRWSPRRARADLAEHQQAVQAELAALQNPKAA